MCTVTDFVPGYPGDAATVVVPAGEPLSLRGFVRGSLFSWSPDDLADLAAEELDGLADDPGWRYELGDIEILPTATHIVSPQAFAEWYPHYELSSSLRDPRGDRYDPADFRIVVNEVRIANRTDEAVDVPWLFLCSSKFVGARDGSLNHFALVSSGEREAIYGIPSDGFVVNELPDDWARVEAGETRTILYPATVSRGDFSDPDALESLSPSDFHLAVFNCDPAVQYCLELA